MRRSIATLLFLMFTTSALDGCAVVGATPSPTRDGKCHGPDYNAPDCVYLF